LKRKILFVDDELQILEGLRVRLHRLRDKWEMAFAESGEKALACLAGDRFDVIVTDMRMPGMDGAALLQRVQAEFPDVARIVLSGHSEFESSLRAAAVAHQFLNKPSEPGAIEDAVERACGLRSLIGQETLRRVVGGIGKLPSVPRVYSQLLSALADDGASVAEVAAILKQDMAVSAKTLQLANSAFFRLAKTVSKVEEAVAFLGLETIKQVVLAVEVFGDQAARGRSVIPIEELQAHAMLVADVAASLFGRRGEREDAAVAGLLHDVGKLILSVELPDRVAGILRRMSDEGISMHVAEEQELGVTHAEVGGYLLGLWGLPYPIVEAVANHHAPSRVDCSDFGLLAAVHVADGLVHGVAGRAESEESDTRYLDMDFLGQVGVRDRLRDWIGTTRKIVEAHGPRHG
jgi:HD-like signal output (HDOD) protein